MLRRIAVVGVALALVSSACGQPGTERSEAIESGGTIDTVAPDPSTRVQRDGGADRDVDATLTENGSRDLSAYFITERVRQPLAAQVEVMTAYTLLVERCARDAGLDVEVLPADLDGLDEVEELKRLSLFFDDLPRLIDAGYGALQESWLLGSGSRPTVIYDSAAGRQDVFASCHQAARQRLNGDVAPPNGHIPEEVYGAESAMTVAMEAALRDHAGSWSQCMAGLGFPGARIHYPPPIESPSDEEAAMASDFQCRVETGYTDALLAFRSARVAEFWAVDHPEVEQQLAVAEAELQVAREVLDEFGVVHD